jgi:hypothetical protein
MCRRKRQGHGQLDTLTDSGRACYLGGDITAVHATCHEADKCQRNDKRTGPPWLELPRA